MSLDSGCNGVVFIQMHKRPGEPGPSKIVQHMMTKIASTRKHMSRSIFHTISIFVNFIGKHYKRTKLIQMSSFVFQVYIETFTS